MSFAKCFDVVEMVTDEATKRFSPLFCENEDAKDILKQYCTAIDSLVKEFDGESIEVDVDEINMTIKITVEFPDIVVESFNHLFYALAERAISVRFFVGEDGLLAVSYLFPSIWSRA